MRQIGTLPNADEAHTFEGFLLTRGVKSKVEEADEEWLVWIYDEDDVEQARQELSDFRENPQAEHFVSGAQAAANLRREEEKQRKRSQKQVVDMRTRWSRPMSQRVPVTTALIAISVVVIVLGTNWNVVTNPFSSKGFCQKPDSFVSLLYIVPNEIDASGRVTYIPSHGLRAIRQGQIWRAVTPIFLHFGLLHILFNMMWLRDLGGAIEMRRGRFRFLVLVLLIAALSNVAQYYRGGPFFGGMSGVVFGLFGYIWIKSRYQPESGFYMPPRLAFFMMAWFLICFTGAVGPIANTAHGVGLMVGMVAAYWPVFTRKMLGH